METGVLVAVVIGAFLLLIALGIRVTFALGAVCVMFASLLGDRVTLTNISDRAVSQLARSWVLLSVPLFIMVGEIFKFALADRLVNMSNVFFGKVRGGLAIVNVVASFFFGGISGSAAADTASIGGILIPAMIRSGYGREFSVVVTITSSTLGPIVPPSVLMIMFAWVTGGSVAALFSAGYIPGALMCLALSLLAYVLAVRRRYPAYERPPLRECMCLLADAVPALLTVLIIVVGIVFGVFTATESAAVAVVYGALVASLYYRELKFKHVPEILMATARTTGVVGLLIAFASAFSWLLTYAGVPFWLTEVIVSLQLGRVGFLLVVMVLLLILGCFMNPVAALLMSMPLLYPPAVALGIHPLHLGAVVVVSLAMGHVTPPVGVCLFIGSAIANVPIARLIPELIPFFAVMLTVDILLILLPEAVLFLPRLLGYA